MALLMTPVKFMTRVCEGAIKPNFFKQSDYQVQAISGVLRISMHAKFVGT